MELDPRVLFVQARGATEVGPKHAGSMWIVRKISGKVSQTHLSSLLYHCGGRGHCAVSVGHTASIAILWGWVLEVLLSTGFRKL
jgi:hypothetical protein